MLNGQRIIAVLAYEDIQAAHDFLVAAFGFEGVRVDRDDGGRAVHGEVRHGGEQVWLHRVTAEHGMASPRSLPAVSAGLVVIVDDVDAHHERARAAGAEIRYPPTDQPYGLREYGAVDLEGAQWSFATPLADAG
jgi:uncharacterized glyoxalase superfamily protein PhnB